MNPLESEEAINPTTEHQPTSQAEESLGQSSQSEANSAEQVATPPSTEPKSPEFTQEQYKSLQGDYTKKAQALKEYEALNSQFDAFGGAEELIKAATSLQGNERFAEFLKSEQERDQYGISPDEHDEDTRQALSLVEKVVDQRANAIVEKVINEQLNPLIAQNQESHMNNVFDQLDDTIPDWRDVKDTMKELAGNLPDSVVSNPSLNDLTGLYYRAIAENPEKFSELAAKSYEEKIQSTKSKSIDKPGGAMSGSSGKASSFAEAVTMAKSQLG